MKHVREILKLGIGQKSLRVRNLVNCNLESNQQTLLERHRMKVLGSNLKQKSCKGQNCVNTWLTTWTWHWHYYPWWWSLVMCRVWFSLLLTLNSLRADMSPDNPFLLRVPLANLSLCGSWWEPTSVKAANTNPGITVASGAIAVTNYHKLTQVSLR